MRNRLHIFSSESVSEGHPDKVSDFISDRILDEALSRDPSSRVACETLCKGDTVVIAGEITTGANLDVDSIVREAVRHVGYQDSDDVFDASRLRVVELLTQQAVEIADGVDRARDDSSTGAGDQGIMFGYATGETESLMPLSIALAHGLTKRLAVARHDRELPGLRPDAKAQVSVTYEGTKPLGVETVLVSSQHSPDLELDDLRDWVRDVAIPQVVGGWLRPGSRVLVNPAGTFHEGGPSIDCGLTGRKIIVDTYGGMARHGGGAFSGKDATKVDRSAAYFCRWVARQIIEAGIADRAELQVAYAIGMAEPVSMRVETFGTGDPTAAEEFATQFDFRPSNIIEELGLRRPLFSESTNYGHFGRVGLPWEEPAG